MIHEKNKSYRDGKFWYGLLNRFTVELLNDIKYGRDTISGAKEHAGNECRKVKEELIDKIIADNKNKTVLLNNFPDSVGVEIHIAD